MAPVNREYNLNLHVYHYAAGLRGGHCAVMGSGTTCLNPLCMNYVPIDLTEAIIGIAKHCA
jgi:hypothetical protein